MERVTNVTVMTNDDDRRSEDDSRAGVRETDVQRAAGQDGHKMSAGIGPRGDGECNSLAQYVNNTAGTSLSSAPDCPTRRLRQTYLMPY